MYQLQLAAVNYSGIYSDNKEPAEIATGSFQGQW